MMTMMAFLWDKTPNYIKWPISIGFILFLIPLKIRDEAYGLIDARVHAVILPMKDKRDLEITQMKDDLKEIKEDTRDIKKILILRRR
jgi:hypothetical protein